MKTVVDITEGRIESGDSEPSKFTIKEIVIKCEGRNLSGIRTDVDV